MQNRFIYFFSQDIKLSVFVVQLDYLSLSFRFRRMTNTGILILLSKTNLAIPAFSQQAGISRNDSQIFNLQLTHPFKNGFLIDWSKSKLKLYLQPNFSKNQK